jgi:predicted MPP superfamily phosphohydrolase
MKLIAIGDIHGRSSWKEIVESTDADKIIFVGDYFDSKDNLPAKDQIDNFKQILSLKRDNLDKVVLLFGNHDFHYLSAAEEQYSGFQDWSQYDIAEVLHEAVKERLVQMAYVQAGYLFSHAGITKTWLTNHGYAGQPLDAFVNDLFYHQPKRFRFQVGKNRSPSGEDITQSPIWVRPTSLSIDAVEGFIQVVGHTQQRSLTITNNLILIDALGTSGEYLVIENNKPTAVHI